MKSRRGPGKIKLDDEFCYHVAAELSGKAHLISPLSISKVKIPNKFISIRVKNLTLDRRSRNEKGSQSDKSKKFVESIHS